MKKFFLLNCLVIALLIFSVLFKPTISRPYNHESWQSISEGVEYGLFRVGSAPSIGDGRIHIIRIDPTKAELKAILASEHDKKTRTASQWCRDFKLTVAINAGMYQTDYLTNVGYLRNGLHVQNKRWNRMYKSALVFGPKKEGIPAAAILDLDEPDSRWKSDDYNTVIQNLRLMKGNGVNVWSKTDKKWSEAAVGIDKEGRILFLFCRSPYNMKFFNESVKALLLGIERLMHVEGGPEASLSVHSTEVNLNLSGSYETGLRSDDTNKEQWPIPNVIGVSGR
jgi:hypothetical protein